ncbi:glutamine amidotransferase class-II [Gloeomargarita lithophora Alchichica-D10]|uniref:Glutamine amidotransferase class-II n=1 Tax=Gloeomargarita lithophora Alchichica-D10 TaxID=1188229 RepID=A0A1J0ACV6_9CYAN|nr:ergothioneine biosynthesis protein EgtC [Gloeomargarita lithophora]APB33770.1 glutamine amidotransferase class-II [Gloeomargarita lithophora Alchichica-D10]
MCRLVAYLGKPLPLKRFILEPPHSLLVQSYAPQEMTAGLLNGDGFGLGWYDRRLRPQPFTYKNILPIWNDPNLAGLCEYVTPSCLLGYVRSATPGLAVDYSNCQPFVQHSLSAVHNGRVENFRSTLYRPLRQQLTDEDYLNIQGLTDSEHLFAWILHHYKLTGDLAQALSKSFVSLLDLVPAVEVTFNFILSDGQRLIASRLAHGGAAPSLYYLSDHPDYPGVVIASEPLFKDERWVSCPPGAILVVTEEFQVQRWHPPEARAPTV